MCFKVQKNPNSLISSRALIYLVNEFSPMALSIEWLALLIKLHLIVRWFASHVGFFYLLTSEAPLLGLAKSIYYAIHKRMANSNIEFVNGILRNWESSCDIRPDCNHHFDASGTSNAMFDEVAERSLMSPLAGTKHTYVRLAIIIYCQIYNVYE